MARKEHGSESGKAKGAEAANSSGSAREPSRRGKGGAEKLSESKRGERLAR